MSWLRAVFSRPPRAALPRAASTAWGQTIQRMAAADDHDERARLGALLSIQLESYLSSEADNTLVALLELEERIRAGQGETNDMIGEAVGLIRGQGAVLNAARAEFRDGLSAFGARVSGLEVTVARHSQEIASFERSRDRSIAERAQHTADLAESKAHRKTLQEGQERLEQGQRGMRQAIEHLSEQVEALLMQRAAGDAPQEAGE